MFLGSIFGEWLCSGLAAKRSFFFVMFIFESRVVDEWKEKNQTATKTKEQKGTSLKYNSV